MTFNKTRGRHRAENTGVRTTISQAVAGRGRTIGSTAAVVVAGSGIMLGMAAPASAGVVANDNYTPTQAVAPAPVAPVAAAPAAAPAAAAATHTVVSGDTLGQISSAYGVGLDTVLSLNGLSVASVIYPGDVITVAGEAAPAIAAEPAAFYAPAAAAAPVAAPAEAANTGVISTQSASIAPAVDTPAAASGTNAIMLASAQSQIGAAQDCTVLVEVALRAAGHNVGDLGPAQLAAYGTQVSTPEPGDMVFYADGGMGMAHIAIYVGNGEAIHSGWNGNQTVVQSVNVGSGPVFYRA